MNDWLQQQQDEQAAEALAKATQHRPTTPAPLTAEQEEELFRRHMANIPVPRGITSPEQPE